jgi:hypothetical protein
MDFKMLKLETAESAATPVKYNWNNYRHYFYTP